MIGNYLKIASVDVKETLAEINKDWNQTFSNYVYEAKFLDQKIENFYSEESKLSSLYSIFAAIAIFIS